MSSSQAPLVQIRCLDLKGGEKNLDKTYMDTSQLPHQ